MQLTSSIWFRLLVQILFLLKLDAAIAAELSTDMTISELEYEIADNPRLVNDWARHMLTTTSKAQAPDKWVKVMATLMLSSKELGEDRNALVSQYRKEIEDALPTSKLIRLWQEYDIFQSTSNQIRFASDFDAYIVEDLKLLSFLFKNAPIDVALIRLSQIAGSLSEHGRRAAARKYANQAKLILKENPQISAFRRQSINVIIALILLDDADTIKLSQEMFEDATKTFKKIGRRHALAMTSYNYAANTVYQGHGSRTPPELEKAIGYLDLAAIAAHEIGDPILEGQSKAVIAHALNKLHKFAEAETVALEALNVLKDLNDIATMSASIAVATAQIELKKFSEAKEHLSKAEDIEDRVPGAPLNLRVEMKKMLSQLSFANKSFDKAFRYQVEYYYLDNEWNRRTRKIVRSRSKTKVDADDSHLLGAEPPDFYQQNGLWLIITLALLAIGLGLLLYRKSKTVQKLEAHFEAQTLQRSFHPKLVEEYMLGRSNLDESTQKKLVSVLFADIVDFNRMSEKLGPERLTKLLNSFFEEMSAIVFDHEGMLDKFLANGVMVVFGVPQSMGDKEQAIRTLHCAVEMMQKLAEMNKEWQKVHGFSLEMRIGINQGESVVGSFGTERRKEYTAIGTTVKLASKIQLQARPGQVLLSESLARFFQEDCEAAGDLVLPKSEKPVPVFEYPWHVQAETMAIDSAV